jgi:hypothetical protein
MKTGKSRTLNTVWHGAFAFVLREDGIEVLTPKLSEHAHYAGTSEIGGLHKVPNGAHFVLRGVKRTKAGAGFDPKYNFIVKGSVAQDVEKSVQSAWMLPHPMEISTLQRITIQKDDFTGTIPEGIHIPREFGAVQVLTFELESDALPSVEGLPEWAPEGDAVINLHVYAEEETGWSTKKVLEHPTNEFRNLLKLTEVGEKSHLAFDYTPGEIPLVEPDTRLPEGLRKRELVSLAANGFLDRDHSEVKAARGAIEIGANSGHPCANLVVSGNP